MTREFHPIVDLFPLMDESALGELAEDIREHGLRELIWLHEDGRIIDGRNRYLACKQAGLEPRYRTWCGGGSLLAFVVSLNLKRRHLNESQRTMIAAKVETMKHGGRRGQDANLHLEVTRADAAKLFNVSERGIASARHVLDHATPELIEAVEQGKLAVSAAAGLVEADVELQRRVVEKLRSGEAATATDALRRVRHEDRPHVVPPTGKYRVLYADPPWEYGNAGLQQYGHASHHYPTMSIKELSALPIAELAEDNAVLFLWVTSPILEECFAVVHAWGFTYKSSFVWDKVKHNFGHYNSVRHEFLLICTRGSCTPDTQQLADSVMTIERGKHSEKPEAFRQIIEALYPQGSRIELFARRRVEGWDAYGNEPEARTSAA